jgi:AI-2 transport protein TqsA
MNPTEQRVQTVCLVLLTTLATGVALYWLRPVMIPFVLALFVSLILSSAVDFQQRHLKLPRPVAMLATTVLAAFAFGLLALVISASVGQLTANSGAYNQQLASLLEEIVALLPENLQGLIPQTDVTNLSQMAVRAVGSILLGTTNAVLGVLSQFILVLIFVIFLMLGGDSDRRASGVWGEAEKRVKRYLVTKAAISAATGTLVYLTLTLLGIDLALAFGLFAFLLNFIPNVGSIVATLLPLPVVIVSPDVSATTAVLALAIPGTIQIVIGNILDPRIMGESLDLHPVVVLISLIFWGMLWGIAGALMAVPITAVLKIVLEKFEGTRVIADVMAGRLDRWRSPEPR